MSIAGRQELETCIRFRAVLSADRSAHLQSARKPRLWDRPFVADTGLVAALPLSLSATPKRKSDRRRHEARRDRSFVKPEASQRLAPLRLRSNPICDSSHVFVHERDRTGSSDASASSRSATANRSTGPGFPPRRRHRPRACRSNRPAVAARSNASDRACRLRPRATAWIAEHEEIHAGVSLNGFRPDAERERVLRR
jgi:hypothetical protein